MIWQKRHISSKATHSETFIKNCIDQNQFPEKEAEDVFRIGIVGGGPKGLYAIDHFLHRVNGTIQPFPVEIYWFNETSNYGCGPNYQIDQPEYLLINYCIGNIDGWDRRGSGGTERNRLNLVDWLKKFNTTGQEVKPTDYASRALVGCYLQHIAALVIQSRPEHVRLILIVDEVTDITYSNRFQVKLRNTLFPLSLNNILLSTGHCYSNNSLLSKEQTSTRESSMTYISNPYPVDKLDKIPAGNRVGIVGMGLTFVDVALHLTEGRGGRFNTAGDYCPSGLEPVLYPFSRNNLPILPRGPVYGSQKYELYYLDENWARNMREIKKSRKVDFFKEIFPPLQKEAHFAYYSTLLNTRSIHEVDKHTEKLTAHEKFRMEELLFPTLKEKGNLQRSFIDMLETSIREAELGELRSPMLAAAAVWREAIPIVGEIYQNGGFTGKSQKRFDEEFLGAFCRTSFGPPVENAKKILALARAGIIRFEFDREVSIDYVQSEKTYLLQTNNNRQGVDFLVDARVAGPSLLKKNASLYGKLWDHKLIEPFDNQGYQPGCPQIDEKGQTAASPTNKPPLFFYGSNTEGVMLDNDSLSRTRNDLGAIWAEFSIRQILQTKTIQNETTC